MKRIEFYNKEKNRWEFFVYNNKETCDVVFENERICEETFEKIKKQFGKMFKANEDVLIVVSQHGKFLVFDAYYSDANKNFLLSFYAHDLVNSLLA